MASPTTIFLTCPLMAEFNRSSQAENGQNRMFKAGTMNLSNFFPL